MSLSAEQHANRAAWLQLVLTSGLGPVTVQELLRQFGLPEDVLAASATALAKVLPPNLIAAVADRSPQRLAQIDANLDWAGAPDRHLIALNEPEYPQQLLNLTDPPPLLWVIGDVRLLQQPCLAIVGSRHASQSGVAHSQAFARALGDAGWTIVSGLAQGIDAAAHRGGLASRASTIAFVGNGLDRVYPAVNRDLAHQIAAQGAIVSEFSLGTPPMRDHFPRRNRLIATIALGTLIVEAARQSGSLITARLAAEAGRDVFAIPGSIDSPLAKGCHALIKQGAKLVESAEDVLGELSRFGVRPDRLPADRQGPNSTSNAASGLAASAPPAISDEMAGNTAELQALLQFVGWDPISVDQLAQRSGAAVAQLSSNLLLLELAGRVERLRDGRYQQLVS